MSTTVQPEFLTRRAAAAYLSVSLTQMRRWYANNYGPRAVKMGTKRASRVRYARRELDAFMADPAGYAVAARPEQMPHFEPPSRGNPRRRKGAAT